MRSGRRDESSVRPLATFERAMVRTQRHQPFNVVVVVRVRPCPTEETVRAALERLVELYPALGGRIDTVQGRPALVADDPRPLPLAALERRKDSAWRRLVDAELNRVLDLDQGPLVSVTLLGPGEDRVGEIALTLAHVLVDETSGARLLEQLVRLCAAEAAGEGSKSLDPPPFPSPESRFPARHQGLGGWWRRTVALGRQLGGEGVFAVKTLRQPKPVVEPGAACRALSVRFTADQTSRLLATARRHRVTLNSALNAAFALAVDRHLRDGSGGPFRTFTMSSLRPHLDPPIDDASLGAAWAMMRFVGRVRPGMGVWELAEDLQKTFAAGLRRGDRFTAYQTSETMMRVVLGGGKLRMSELAVSYTGAVDLPTAIDGIELEDVQVFVSTIDLGPWYVVQGRIWRGALACGAVYLESDLDADSALRLAIDAKGRLLYEETT